MPAQVFLNHFYTTVDPETYAAIENSPFLRHTFAVFEKRTTVRQDRTYSGLYLYGDNTYFEFFEAGKDNAPTPVGIAFGVEQSGALAKLAAQWPSQGMNATPETVTRQLDGIHIPWFLSLAAPRPAGPVVRMFMMEYLPEFLERWHDEAPTPKGIARRDVLARYAAVLRKGNTLMAGVTRIHLQVAPEEEARLKQVAGAMGCLIEGRDIVTSDARIRLVPPLDSGSGIRQIVMSLRSKPGSVQRFQLGRSRLEILPEGRAVWSF